MECHGATNSSPERIVSTAPGFPLGTPGQAATYHIAKDGAIPASVITTYILHLGPVEEKDGTPYQWLHVESHKANGDALNVWLLTSQYPTPTVADAQKTTVRYMVKEATRAAVEYRHLFTGEAVLPSLGAWEYLFPRAADQSVSQEIFPKETRYLGHPYRLENLESAREDPPPMHPAVLELLPDVLIGVPHNTRQKDETRRWDDSEYEYIPMTESDYNEMIASGMNCLFVNPEQVGWVETRNVFYWGIGGNAIRYPDHLYRSNYLGPILFLDEPAVCTRDYVIRPRLKAEPDFRKTITPQIVFQEFKKYYDEVREKNPTALLQGLSARSDVDLGDMAFLQQNLYTWETMVCTAAYQLGGGKNRPPASMVFEPPGHLGTWRTLPELNMAYRCQIPVDNPKNLIDIIYGFLRGAARRADKEWGTSIYGAVDRADAFWFMTHAYDLGAQFFFFWDSARLACVPFHECLILSRNLRAHAANYPHRDLPRLKHAAEVAILLPPGYNLGHVYMGKGLLWGLSELNLERRNREGITYRTVMGNFFTEIERCIRLGVAFDLLWDLESLPLTGYREIVRIREDGKVEIIEKNQSEILPGPRIPNRPPGDAPQMSVDLSAEQGKAPLPMTARTILSEGASPIFYTPGPDDQGVVNNVMVFWELYGPSEEDYRVLVDRTRKIIPRRDHDQTIVEIKFQVGKSGTYRLRAASCDLAGRTTEVWKTITVAE